MTTRVTVCCFFLQANLMAQTYQRPMIEVSNTQICNPSLSNIASKGGTITSYGDEQQVPPSACTPEPVAWILYHGLQILQGPHTVD